MIKFSIDGGDLKEVAVGGSTEQVLAELALEVSIIYGALMNRDKEEAESFRRLMILTMTDPEISRKIFSTELFDHIKDSSKFIAASFENPEEFLRQLKEIMDGAE